MDLGDLLDGSDTEPVEIAVFGMACQRCETTVQTVLTDHEAVSSAEADRKEDVVRVETAPDIPVDELIARIRAVGYEARRSSPST